MEEDKNSFLDSRTLTAIILVAVVFFGWQSYLSHKYPNLNKPQQITSTPSTVKPDLENKNFNQNKLNKEEPKKDIPTQVLKFQNEDMAFDISSDGMEIKKVELKKYLDRDKKNIFIGDSEGGLFGTSVLGENKNLKFDISIVNDTTFNGIATTEDGVKITKTIEVTPSKFLFKSKIIVEKIQQSFSGISVSINERRAQVQPSSFLTPTADIQEAVIKYSGKEERIPFGSSKDGVKKKLESVTVSAIGSHYFAAGVVDKSDIAPETIVIDDPNSKDVSVYLNYKFPTSKDKIELNQTAFVGPKILKLLQDADKEFESLIDFGMFASIARVLLGTMKWFYSNFGNWGFSIIFLTILVRLLVLPFNIASYKSMKKMQSIQPLLQSVRERYKDDAQTLNRETMSLMREHKVNPVGGCLPMLLQMPIFFALYQVFGQSIELYQAPFIFWIKDLSLKDPYYVLPVLMVIAMFLQQKLTPTTMDPTQAKIMQWLPVVFGFMMIALPSGLTLYILVSTIFGVIQQHLFIRDGNKPVVSQMAKAKI